MCSSPFSLLSCSPFWIRRLNAKKKKKTQDDISTIAGIALASGQTWVFLVSLSRHQVATLTDYLNEFRGRSVLRFVQQRKRCPLLNVCLFRFPFSVAYTTLLHVEDLVEIGASTHRRCAPTSSQVDWKKKKSERDSSVKRFFFGGGPHPRAALPSEKKKVEEVKTEALVSRLATRPWGAKLLIVSFVLPRAVTEVSVSKVENAWGGKQSAVTTTQRGITMKDYIIIVNNFPDIVVEQSLSCVEQLRFIVKVDSFGRSRNFTHYHWNIIAKFENIPKTWQ